MCDLESLRVPRKKGACRNDRDIPVAGPKRDTSGKRTMAVLLSQELAVEVRAEGSPKDMRLKFPK